MNIDLYLLHIFQLNKCHEMMGDQEWKHRASVSKNEIFFICS